MTGCSTFLIIFIIYHVGFWYNLDLRPLCSSTPGIYTQFFRLVLTSSLRFLLPSLSEHPSIEWLPCYFEVPWHLLNKLTWTETSLDFRKKHWWWNTKCSFSVLWVLFCVYCLDASSTPIFLKIQYYICLAK